MAGRLLRRQLQLERRHRAARQAAAPDELLARRPRQPGQRRLQAARQRAAEVRAELVRHERVHALLQAERRAALLRREPAQPARQRLPRMGRVLQRAGRPDDALRHARRGRRQGPVQGRVLGRRQRVLGLRRPHDAGGVLAGVPPLHLVRAPLRRRAQVRRRGAEQRRSRLDAALLRQHGRARTSSTRSTAGRSTTTPTRPAAATRSSTRPTSGTT